MGFIIESGTNKPYKAKVFEDGALSSRAITLDLQHHYAVDHGSVYQVIGTASVNNSTHTVLHIKNTSTTLAMGITFIRMQAVGFTGGTALPAAASYFQLGRNTLYSTGGTAVTPVNTSFSSGNIADVTAYNNSPAVTGTFTELDRWYIEANGKMVTFEKRGSIILGTNDTVSVRCTTDHTAGTAYARVTFFMFDPSL